MPRKDREAYNKRQKEQRRRRQAAVGYANYYSMLAAQDGVCAICKQPPATSRHFHIDHDHESGIVRGLLCGPCNMGLGLFKDDVDRLRAAMEYLLLHDE